MKPGYFLAPLAATTAFAAVLPGSQGQYAVQWKSRELIDWSRLDPFNSSHVRRLMISRFSPTPHADCKKTCRLPYMPTAIADIEDEILNAYLGPVGWPMGIIAELKLDVCCQTHGSYHRQFPTILFGPGLNTTRLFYSAAAQNLASAGFEVIVLDHPYETDVVQFPDGEIMFGGRIGRDPENETELVRGLEVRTKDISFVMDHLDIHQTVYVGQSFGGASVAAAMLAEPRILGGVNLDGALWGPVKQLGVGKPFLIIGAEGHNTTSLPDWGEFNRSMAEKRRAVWFKMLNVKDAVHGSFLDFSLIGDASGLRDRKELESFWGRATGRRVMEVLGAYMVDFFGFVMSGGEEGLLRGPSPDFPDVSFLE